jgi:hypothetical protein
LIADGSGGHDGRIGAHSLRAFGRILPWLLLLLAAVDLIGLKSGSIEHPPGVLAVLVVGVVVCLLARLGIVVWSAVAGRRPRGAAAGEALLAGGVLLALAAGSANWALALQGFVVLNEGEAVPLHAGSHLQQFEGGPLAKMEEMEVVMTLEELELRPSGPGFYYPQSRLLVQRGNRRAERITVGKGSTASAGPLRFYQGAFGFAPRIVILRDDETLFDRSVPFTTRRDAARGLGFSGSFTVEQEQLEVRGNVDLAGLDEGMRGHATLLLAVARDGVPLGRGELLPGHFADLEQGYRIGFAGLDKWSEIDLSRQNYGGAVLAGALLALVGAVLWPLAAWRSG